MTPQQTRDLIIELVGRYVDRPADLRCEFQTTEKGDVYWMMKGHETDEGKLVGIDGCHVNALESLIVRIGTEQRKTYTFRLLTIGEPRRRPQQAPRDVIEYDPRPARDLLCRLLYALAVQRFSVEVGPGSDPRRSLTFVFRVKTASYIDGDMLDALGTLFRAIAKKDGVRFQISLAS